MSDIAQRPSQAAFEADDQAADLFRARARRLTMRRRILPVVTLLVLVLIWEAGVRYFEVPNFIAPAPSAVFATLWSRFSMFMENLAPTAMQALAGYVIGNLAAVAVATTFVYRPTAEEAFFPLAVMMNTVPTVAKAPILVLLLGNGMEPKVAIAALICFFPTLVNMTRGLRAVSSQQLELMRILSASEREVFTKLRLKNAMPYLFAALKITAPSAVIGSIVAEWIGSTRGIGALIIEATYNYDSVLLYATIIVGATFSAAFFGVVSLFERHFLKWNDRANQ
jgi:NitT/TauT family transport system permease protein